MDEANREAGILSYDTVVVDASRRTRHVHVHVRVYVEGDLS